ncbi:uncharacterized protein LOC132746149 [Ruditapes philippinarum]|uniref:uncharacterized protein LOC132746149 n=1 Tax=Ruditapes philippinarum TaxID=129788 RepID=UPI00295A81DC|nr:uncharacterized protein LOC132746149 [Ruditapes philippinarum]
MGFGEASLFAKIGFVLLIIAFILQLLGIALPYWYSVDKDSYDAYGGLFRGCFEIASSNKKTCDRMKNVADYWAATQAFELIGFFLVVGALILSIIVLFIKSDMKILKLICWILCFCACGFIIVGIIIYGAEAEGIYAEFSGAFAITIIAGIISLAAGVLWLLDWMGKAM